MAQCRSTERIEGVISDVIVAGSLLCYSLRITELVHKLWPHGELPETRVVLRALLIGWLLVPCLFSLQATLEVAHMRYLGYLTYLGADINTLTISLVVNALMRCFPDVSVELLYWVVIKFVSTVRAKRGMSWEAEHALHMAGYNLLLVYGQMGSLEELGWGSLRPVCTGLGGAMVVAMVVAIIFMRIQSLRDMRDMHRLRLHRLRLRIANPILAPSCAICLEDFWVMTPVIAWPCDHRHVFHVECAWRLVYTQTECPLCREQP